MRLLLFQLHNTPQVKKYIMECTMDTSETSPDCAKDKTSENDSEPRKFANFDKLIHEKLPENGKDPVLENLVSTMESQINNMKKSSENDILSNDSKLNEPINLNLLQIIATLCTENNYDNLVDSGLVKVCMCAVQIAKLPSLYIKNCIGILSAVAPFHVDTCKYITAVTKESQKLFHNICHLFTTFLDCDKIVILTLFDNIIKQALTLDDYVFDAILFKTVSALDTTDNGLLLQCVIGIDNLIETYQEWDVNKKLLGMSIVPSLVKTLTHSSEEIVLKSLRSLGNLLSAESQTINQCVISGGIINHLMLLLLQEKTNNDIVRSCFWVLSNIAAGPQGSIKCFFEFDLVPIVLQYFMCKHGDVALECLWVLANIFEDASIKERRWFLKNEEILTTFVNCLSEPKSNMQGASTEGFVYLELLRDTFQTVLKCLKQPKKCTNNVEIKDSQQSSESNDTSDNEDEKSDDENEKLIYNILSNDEIKTLLRYLLDSDLHGKLLHLKTSEDCAEMNDTFKDILEDFKNVVSKHLNIQLSIDKMDSARC